MTNFRIIETLDQFRELNTAWNELLTNNPAEHVYMKHEWFDCWLRSRQDAISLSLVTGWRDGQLVSVAPLHRNNIKIKKIPFKTLEFLQSGITPRCHFLAESKEELEKLLGRIMSLNGWDLLIADNLEEKLPATRTCIDYWKDEGISFHVDDGFVAPLMDIEGTWEDYLKSLTRKRRGFINSECLSRLRKSDQHAFECITAESEFERVFPIMLDISARSWKNDTGDAIGQVRETSEFYRMFTPVALRNNWVQIWLLQVNNKYVGFDYILTWKNLNTLIRTEFDREFSYFHPGENLKIAFIRELFKKEGVQQYDFGGVPTKYKLKWSSDLRKHVSLTVAHGNFLSRSVLFWKSSVAPLIARSKRENN